jgi:hypothetical protein
LISWTSPSRSAVWERGSGSPATLKAINELVVGAAVKLGVEDGSKLRVDTTVVETDIHHPTDNTLLWDVVRVLTRLLYRNSLPRTGRSQFREP